MSTLTTARVNHLALAQSFARDPHAWPIEPQFDRDNRWYACLAEDPDAQVWLLTWLPGQATDLHDHGGSAGAFVVVSGVLTEETVARTPSGIVHTRDVVTPGHGRRFGARHVHRITNGGRVPAISIHVYGPALRAMTRYRLDGDHLRVAAVERAGVSW
jgi:predicted metal-dependent enzyme (double-stranded beta helix superfamily)